MQWEPFRKKYRVKEGHAVRVETREGTQEGVIMPPSNSGNLKLKLPSGYNTSIPLSSVTKITIRKRKSVKSPAPEPAQKNPNLPTIAMVNTGGTIVSRVDYSSGAVYASATPEDIIALYPDLSRKANIRSRMVMNVASEDMRHSDWKKIATAVGEEIKKGAAGVIIGHGTDTLHFTAAMMAFMLEQLPVPVLVVGSQRSSDRGSSDAAINLSCAFDFILKSDFAEVGICMHENLDDHTCVILPATKTRKMHTSRRDTFRAINDIPIARVTYPEGNVEFLKKEYGRKGQQKLVLKTNLQPKVGLLKLHPAISSRAIDFYRKEKYKGLVIEGTGIGNAPVSRKENRDILKAIEKLVNSGCVTVLCSQAFYGRVHMHVYRAGTLLTKAGVIPGEDMLSETALAKLCWLLANAPKKEIPSLMRTNLRGEITPRSRLDDLSIPFEETAGE